MGVLYQCGTNPQRIGRSLRPPCPAVTTTTGCVGQML